MVTSDKTEKQLGVLEAVVNRHARPMYHEDDWDPTRETSSGLSLCHDGMRHCAITGRMATDDMSIAEAQGSDFILPRQTGRAFLGWLWP